MQYTLRKIPRKVDQALRRRAKTQRRSLNDVALEALAKGAGIGANGEEPVKHIDLSGIAGTWVEDPIFDQIRAEHERIDPADWR